MPDQNDSFSKFYTNIDSPAVKAFAIASSNTANTTHTTRSVYIGSTGNLVCELADMVSGNTVTFASVPTGTILPIRVRKVLTTTTANSIIGMY